MSKCDVWICLGRGNDCLTLAEPDDDQALAALVNEELDVRGVIRARLRFAVLGVVPSGLCFEQALVCRVVEALPRKYLTASNVVPTLTENSP